MMILCVATCTLNWTRVWNGWTVKICVHVFWVVKSVHRFFIMIKKVVMVHLWSKVSWLVLSAYLRGRFSLETPVPWHATIYNKRFINNCPTYISLRDTFHDKSECWDSCNPHRAEKNDILFFTWNMTWFFFMVSNIVSDQGYISDPHVNKLKRITTSIMKLMNE